LTADSNSTGDFEQPAAENLCLPPWEERERYGFINALYLTVRDSLYVPRSFFARMPSRLGLTQPLLFAMIMGVIGAFFQWMWSLTGATWFHILRREPIGFLEAPLVSGAIFAFSPLLMLVNVFAAAGLVHLILLLIGGNRLGFEATFRVMAYSASAAIFLLIPFCGHAVIFFWALTVVTIGLQEIHEIEGWRAIAAVLLLLLPCLFGCGILWLLNVGWGLLLS
jgi:hypothetical protein